MNDLEKAAVFENEAEEQETQMVQQYLTTDQSKDVSITNVETTGVFSSLSFQLIGADPEFEDFMTELVGTNGGRLVNANAEYMVVDFGCHVKEPCKEGVIQVDYFNSQLGLGFVQLFFFLFIFLFISNPTCNYFD